MNTRAGGIGAREEPGQEAASCLVGRRPALGVLSELLSQTADGVRSAYVRGEAGIGKTRLVDALAREAGAGGIRVVHGYCYESLDQAPYFPFHQVLNQLQLPDIATDALAGHAQTLSPSDSGSMSPGAAAERGRFILRASEAIGAEASSGQTLLIVEDIHWSDVGSLLLINTLLDLSGRGTFIVCTARTSERGNNEMRGLLSQIERKSHLIDVSGFSDQETGTFLEELLGAGRITGEEVSALRSATNGNPLFLKEVVRYLQDAGLLDQHTVKEALQRIRVPDGLTHILDLRLEAIPTGERSALSAGAVVGPEFDAAAVAVVLDEPPERVSDALESLRARGLLQAGADLRNARYRFAHPLFCKRVYDLLSPSRRHEMHRKIALAADAGDISLSVDEVALQHALGFSPGEYTRAVQCCSEATQQAEQVLAFESAASFWEMALACLGRGSRGERAELLRRQGWALWAASQWRRASEAWKQAISLYQTLEDLDQVRSLSLALGDMLRWRQETAEAERWLDRALALSVKGSADRRTALALLASIRCLRDQPEEGLRMLEEAASYPADEGKPDDPRVDFWLSYGFVTVGDGQRAMEIAKRGLEGAQQRGDSQAELLLAATLAEMELGRLRPDSASGYIQIVRQAFNATEVAALIMALQCQTFLWGYSGQWRRVVQECDEWLARVRLAGPYQLATVRFYRGEALHALGDYAGAAADMQQALDSTEALRPAAAIHLARVLAHGGEKDAARRLVDQFGPSVKSTRRAAAARVVLAETTSLLDDANLWAESYELIRNEARPLLLLYSPVSAQRVLGRVATRLGDWPSAIEHFETAFEQLTGGKALWELRLAYLDYAEMRRARKRRGDPNKAIAAELEAKRILDQGGLPDTLLVGPARPAEKGNRFALTGRELEVLALVAEGRRSPEIAAALVVAARTVERHLENIYGKMGVSNRTEAVVLALEEGLIGPLGSARRSNGEVEPPPP